MFKNGHIRLRVRSYGNCFLQPLIYPAADHPTEEFVGLNRLRAALILARQIQKGHSAQLMDFVCVLFHVSALLLAFRIWR